MCPDLKRLYFRKLRMLYCSELQLISFYCEAAARTGDHGVEALTDQSRDRRNLLEVLASLSFCEDVPEEICESVHRLQILNYSVARSLAAKARLSNDVKRLDEVLDTLLESFPLACEAVVPDGMTGSFELARRS